MSLRLRSLAGWCLLVAAIGCVGCRSDRSGRILDENEDDYVGSRAAGAATYDRLINESVSKLLARPGAAAGGEKLRVAYLGVENASAEDLGDFREQIFDLIDTSISTSGRYESLSGRFVERALREAGLKRDDLFLPKYRRTFAQVLEKSDSPVDFLLFSKITSGTTEGESVRQRNYLLTLELVDIETGQREQEAARIRKANKR